MERECESRCPDSWLVPLNPFSRVLQWLGARSRALPTAPYPDAWPGILQRLVPLSRCLAAAERARLLRITQLLVAEVPFEGVGGL